MSSNVHKPVAWPLHKPAGDPAPPARATPDVPQALGPRSSHSAAEPLLRRPAVAPVASVVSPPSLESIIAALSVGEPTNHRAPAWWRKPQVLVAGLAALAVVAPISVGIAVLALSPGPPPMAALPLRRADQTASLPAHLTAPAISAAGANAVSSRGPIAPVHDEKQAAPVRSQSNEVGSAPPSAILRDSQAASGAGSRIAVVEPKKDAPAPETRRLEPHQEASPRPARPAAPPPPAATASPGPAPAASPAPAPMAVPNSKALAEANSRIAAVESERDALAAEVARLERQEKLNSSQHANPPPPAPVAASQTPLPAAPPVVESGLDLSAASASLPRGMPARVLIRYAGNSVEARRRAESLANALTGQGVEVADLRESAGAVRTGLSFSYAPDEAIAQQVGRLVGVAPVRRLQSKDALMARPGTVELNLAGDSHLAAIKTISSRESHHE